MTAIVARYPHAAPDGMTERLEVCPNYGAKKCAHGEPSHEVHVFYEVPVGADKDEFEAEVIELVTKRGR